MGTAIYAARTEGWSLADKIAAEQLYELRKLGWRYAALHFEGGAAQPFPEPILYPGRKTGEQQPVVTWATATLDDIVASPKVLELMKGG